VKLVWTESPHQNLRQIFAYITEENPQSARDLLAEIKKRATILQETPHLGRLGRLEATRELVLAWTHYVLPYRLEDQQIQILAVFHTSRKKQDTFFRP
jgi:toxin ParE1/3/4